MATGDGGISLSFTQEQLWFLDQLRSGAATEYLLHEAFQVRGPVDVDALATAFTRVSERHEVLRTRYETVDDTALQVVDDPVAVPVEVIDLTAVADADTELQRIRLDQRTPIDLRTEPPWRVTLVRLDRSDSVLLITVHHIAFDGWSWGVLARELGELYGELTGGTAAGLAEPPVQYGDYADWQREWWASAEEVRSKQLGYWRNTLAGLAPLDLPTDRPRPSHWNSAGDNFDFTVPVAVANEVTLLARAAGATPFMVYLSAFQLLLGRYAGQRDVAVGVSLAGRNDVQLEPLIGAFVNTIVLRTNLAGAPSFAELLARVRETTLDAYGHQDVPFDRVVHDLAPDRDPSRNPVFQVGFAMHNAERVRLSLPGLEVTKLPAAWTNSAFDLSLHLSERPDGTVHARLMYVTALFDRARIERMAANYLRLLSRALAEPTRPVTRLSLVAEPELHQLHEWNHTNAPTSRLLLPELFLAQARRTPDAVAVAGADGDLTYAELAARVTALTSYLLSRGVTTERPVGVSLHPGADLVTTLLAVLAAGGVYVPLPPEHPAERLAMMVADAGVELIVTNSALRDQLPTAQLIALDSDQALIASAPTAVPPVIHPGNAAYVMYTSGSTGRPKGVTITHGGIRNRVLWSVHRYGMTPGDRVLQKTTIGFDASVWEFLSPLVSGGAVVTPPAGVHRDPAAMVEAVATHGVTVLQLVPSVLRLLVEVPHLADCSALRLLCSAGEPLPIALCERLLDTLDVEIMNTYGPTECAIDSTAAWFRRGEQGETVPIGTPLQNMRAYVVDASDELVPLGVPGELCVSGVGLARGYVGRGDLTAERFRPNPYARVPGERWYRTGDLVRWRDDGVLEFIGRVDEQVKIRGVRVEPAEVEAAVRTHPDVGEAVVTARRGELGDLELVAYTVPANGTPVSLETLAAHLAEVLPAPMIPSNHVGLDVLPLTSNGKVDRAALPEPGTLPASPTDEHVSPRTPTERAVAALMEEVLGIERVGAEDDFFTYGHSLLAIRFVLRLRRTFDIELTVGDLFAARTVAALAAHIDVAAADGPVIPPVPRDGVLPLSFAQQRMWFLDQLEPGSVEYLVPLALRLRGPLDTEALRRAMDSVAARHEMLRTRYVSAGDSPVQVIDPPGPVRFEVVDLTGASDAAVQALVDRSCSQPFDLSQERPLRVTVVRRGAEDHLVAVSLHHVAFDAWSMDLFMRDLRTAYAAIRGGADVPLAPPTVQYADFAAWQRSREAELGDQLDYWRERLTGLDPVELPTDRPRPAVRDPRGGTVSVDVPDELAAGLHELAGRHGATLFMTLLAGFQVLLARYTGRTDLAVGTPVAGRTRPETEELLGFFVNTLVLRHDLSGNPTFVELLDQVRRSSLDAFANQDVPFEHLVDALAANRDMSRNPLFQIMFELAHLDQFPTTLGEAAIEPVHAGVPVAKFDLTLTVKQRSRGRLRCTFEYATGLFDRSTVERLAGHYLNLLTAIVGSPTARLNSLPVLSDGERDVLVREWPDPASTRLPLLDPVDERHRTVPELFERQAKRTPDAVAMVFGEQEVTYRELNERANQLAHHLRSLGVGPEVVVASCLERGPDAVVVLLAALKSGGVYVPFDPDHPTERLDFMLTDAAAHLVVTTRAAAQRLAGHRVVTVDDDQLATAPATDLESPPRPHNLAYVIYTSGSTGRPKGVMIEHRSYVHHCRVISDAYGIGPDDRVVLLSALTFDVAMDQIAATLLAGATVVVSDPVFWTPSELPARLAEHGVTIMEITPAYYRELLEADVDRLSALRLMNVGSDVVTVADARRWAATGLPARFLCNYGPTEATVTCVLHPVAGLDADERDEAAMPIGRPVAGTRGYVLDTGLMPVPVGVPGELCLGGIRLARGYLNRPELTADRFVPDPHSGDPGARLYRTGDLVRWRPDGTIEFIGRIDQQVKVRGFRIELGEIEAALAEHPAVHASVVTVREVGPGEKQLVGYVVPRDRSRPDIAELRAHLRDRVPEYMVPARWVTLDALPLTPSKKVDRKALPAPSAPDGERTLTSPRDETEAALAGIWAEVLDVEQVGIHDNFFELGGHSLLATRVLARIRTAFAVDLPLRRLFEATTVAELAIEVGAAVEADVALLTDTEIEALLAEEEGAR
ncbi:non-ribosomal peptide synthetase [Salinispora oceanensis]|uniref:non-ribosomal peptide synthetase n=1 Tax=Salinispora oceanensis TaxID=1050199 RepID=UPI0003623512|nr:non-ribosomal peptide synthetase [Salinispora oceanensis]